MKCVILAAGYATRLYPLTENRPKPLLPVNGKTILDWLLEDLAGLPQIDGTVVISNHRFAEQFEQWAKTCSAPVIVLDDGTVSNETRLGAVRDIAFAVDRLDLSDDILVAAGDNLLDFSLAGFLAFAREKKSSCVMCYREEEKKKLQKTGVAVIDETGRILSMEEKPKEPKSSWCIPPFYFYRKEDVPLIREGIASGCGVDAPGSFLSWLCRKTAVHAWEMPGRRFDIGDLAGYEYVQNVFHGRK